MAENTDRPIMTLAQLCALDAKEARSFRSLVPWRDFLRIIEVLTDYRITRRALQFYASPQVRLIPLPAHSGRHGAHYRHPEHTFRLAAGLRLLKRYSFPLKLAREILDGLPPDLFGLVIRGIPTAEEVRDLALGDPSAHFAAQLEHERRWRQFASGSRDFYVAEETAGETELRTILTGIDDEAAEEATTPGDLGGFEDWLVDPADHFMAGEPVPA